MRKTNPVFKMSYGKKGEKRTSRKCRALEIRRARQGEEHPSTLGSMISLGILYHIQGPADRAESLYVKTLELTRRVLGEEHPHTLSSMANPRSPETANTQRATPPDPCRM